MWRWFMILPFGALMRPRGWLFFVAADGHGEAEAVAAAEDFVLLECVGATARTTDPAMEMVNIDDDVITWREIGGMERRKEVRRAEAASRKLERVIATDAQIATAFIVKHDI